MTTVELLRAGDVVRVSGVRGVFRVVGHGADGSLTCWGGPSGCEATRSFMPDRCRWTRDKGPESHPERASTRKAGTR